MVAALQSRICDCFGCLCRPGAVYAVPKVATEEQKNFSFGCPGRVMMSPQ